MRKTATIAAALILTISICAGVTAQTSPSSTPANASPAASNTPASNRATEELTPDQAIASLIADLKDLRRIHEETKAERDAAVAALEAEKAERQSVDRSYASAEKEIATLNRSIAHLERAIALHEKTIALVEKQRDDAKAEAKRSKKIALLTALALAAKVLGIF
jgi:chromosome segregation ATPase